MTKTFIQTIEIQSWFHRGRQFLASTLIVSLLAMDVANATKNEKDTDASSASTRVPAKKQKFNLNEYIRTDTTPAYYTLALLDKSMVACNLEAEDVPIKVSVKRL